MYPTKYEYCRSIFYKKASSSNIPAVFVSWRVGPKVYTSSEKDTQGVLLTFYTFWLPLATWIQRNYTPLPTQSWGNYFQSVSPLQHPIIEAIKWKHFPRYCLFVRGIHRCQKGQRRGALIFSLICTWRNGWASNQNAGDLRRHGAHYDATIMGLDCLCGYRASRECWIRHLIINCWCHWITYKK